MNQERSLEMDMKNVMFMLKHLFKRFSLTQMPILDMVIIARQQKPSKVNESCKDSHSLLSRSVMQIKSFIDSYLSQ